MLNDTTTTPTVATFTHEIVTRAAFKSLVSAQTESKSADPIYVMVARYAEIEYFNSPEGLIVFAHDDTIDGQVDGIHPTSISNSILSNRNIVEPLKGKNSGALDYNLHYMTRRSQGSLILKAFGRMIHGGDKEAISISADKFLKLEFYNTKLGLIIGAIEGTDPVWVIRPNEAKAVEL
jgi:hypothetical protein